jgi:hypothetical protein
VDNDQWVNELVFLVLSVTGYPVAVFIDSIILNSIEFWTGENPAETVQVKQIKTENGVFTVTTDANGHKIQKEGSDEVVTFRFDAENSSWSLEAMGQSTTLVQFAGDNQAKVYLADGSTMTVGADRAGVWALKQVVANRMYFANK